VASIGAKQAYLDGELCGVGPDGITSFSIVQLASDSGNAAASHVAAAPICGHDRVRAVIDRLLKNQNQLENRKNLRSSSPHPGPGQTSGEPRRNFAV
jgi:hypothetical protein